MIPQIDNLTVCGIYCAIHRESLRCYVGSSFNLRSRRHSHLSNARRGSLNAFHSALRELGFDSFDFEILEICDKSLLVERESFWIKFFNSASEKGFNTCKLPTGNFPNKMSEVTKRKISLANKGKIVSEETKKRMSDAQKLSQRLNPRSGRVASELTRMRIGAAHKGAIFSEEHRRKLSESCRGRKHKPEAIEKMKASHNENRNYPPRSPEQKQRISEALKLSHAKRKAAKSDLK